MRLGKRIAKLESALTWRQMLPPGYTADEVMSQFAPLLSAIKNELGRLPTCQEFEAFLRGNDETRF